MSCINERDWNDSLNKLKDNGVVILDDFFNKDMCEKLHKRMADEKNFHDDYDTYQAMDYTVEDDLTKLIVEDLHEACPELLSNFERAWSFIYNNKSKELGTDDPIKILSNMYVMTVDKFNDADNEDAQALKTKIDGDVSTYYERKQKTEDDMSLFKQAEQSSMENVGVGDAALNYYKLLAQITKRAKG